MHLNEALLEFPHKVSLICQMEEKKITKDYTMLIIY